MNGRQRLELLFQHKPHECCYCGEPLTMKNGSAEHILPLSFGGNDHFKNLALSCRKCNHRRDNTFNINEFIKESAHHGVVVDPDRPIFKLWKLARIRRTVGPQFRMVLRKEVVYYNHFFFCLF